MHVAVLGAGVIGITTAYYLQKAGHHVTVIERNPAPASECSFANGGQLSYSHAEPWANPATLQSIPKLLLEKHSPLRIRTPMSYTMWCWLLQFLTHCKMEHVISTTQNILELAMLSKNCMDDIAKETGISFSHSAKGTLHLFEKEKSLQQALKQAKTQSEFGCKSKLLPSIEACRELEPALQQTQIPYIGGIYYPSDESGDVHQFTQALARYVEEKGGQFLYNTAIEKAEKNGDKISAFTTSDNKAIKADAYVVAMGAYSGLLLKQLGIRNSIYPVKGYSLTLPLESTAKAPEVCLTDTYYKVVLSRLGNSLRIAGTAEFSGYNQKIRKNRIDILKSIATKLCPLAGNFDHASEWACLRPSTPNGIPIIGPSPLKNLYLNTGHGNLGWTLAAGSATTLVRNI